MQHLFWDGDLGLNTQDAAGGLNGSRISGRGAWRNLIAHGLRDIGAGLHGTLSASYRGRVTLFKNLIHGSEGLSGRRYITRLEGALKRQKIRA